jgi:eukaryotic-like serine/threonine-protein kinase
MALPAQQIPPGEQIGPYQVVRRLGAGGMGEVYLARHRHLNRDAAVKVLLAEISMNQTVVARFFTEARATAQLRHPHIVEIFDCDVLPDGRAYIVMEYLRGESLRSTLDRVGRLCPDYGSIIAIAGMTADALQAAHEGGIVHRDLKPDNTYLTSPLGQREGLSVKILDFGIAKLLSGDRTGSGATPTRTGSLIGTPLYMSPEQCRGISTIDHRADIYSLGCMLYEMIVGQPPFVSEAPGDILMAHIIQPPAMLSAVQPDVPPPIEALVAQMLAKDPAARPQSMAEIIATAETLLGVRKSDFSRSLRAPAGFPDVAAQVPTQILAPGESSAQHLTPAKSPSGRGLATPVGGPASARPASTPAWLGVATPGGAQAPTQTDEGVTPPPSPSQARHKSSSEGRQRPVVSEAGGATDLGLRPSGLRRFLPAIVILAVVAIGGTAAYFLTKPRPLVEADSGKKGEGAGENIKNAEPPPPAEVEIEVLSSPEGAAVYVAGEASARGSTPTKVMLPRSSEAVEIVLKASGYIEKRLSVDGSRDRTMTINLEREVAPIRETEKLPDDKGAKKKKGGNKGATGGGEFKAVGD